ncbi:MAG: hypothetical protein HQL98_14195 [Magnetococcales bacterium]|nr:hypothetical protein [Magnetococcales bacterium]
MAAESVQTDPPLPYSIRSELGFRDSLDFHTRILTLAGEARTGLGQFSLLAGNESGESMNFSPRILPAADRGHLLFGNTLRTPAEPWDSWRYRVAWGSSGRLASGVVEGGLAIGTSHGATDHPIGRDSRQNDSLEYGGRLNWQHGDLKLGGSFKTNDIDAETGFTGYRTRIHRHDNQGTLTLLLPFAPGWAVDGRTTFTGKEQVLAFIPGAFPARRLVAERWTWQGGIRRGDILGFSAITTGLMLNRGEESGSIIARQLDDVTDNLGFYLHLETGPGQSWQFSMERVGGEGRESYLTRNNDLTETGQRTDLRLGMQRDGHTLELRHGRVRATAAIADAGSWEPLLAAFPNRHSPTASHWRENQWELRGEYALNPAWSLVVSGKRNAIRVDQHGLIQDMDEQEASLGVKVSF